MVSYTQNNQEIVKIEFDEIIVRIRFGTDQQVQIFFKR